MGGRALFGRRVIYTCLLYTSKALKIFCIFLLTTEFIQCILKAQKIFSDVKKEGGTNGLY